MMTKLMDDVNKQVTFLFLFRVNGLKEDEKRKIGTNELYWSMVVGRVSYSILCNH